jgi:hypothetical protein
MPMRRYLRGRIEQVKTFVHQMVQEASPEKGFVGWGFFPGYSFCIYPELGCYGRACNESRQHSAGWWEGCDVGKHPSDGPLSLWLFKFVSVVHTPYRQQENNSMHHLRTSIGW